MTAVVIADDEALIRAGVRAILGTDPGIGVVGEAGTGEDLVELVTEARPDVALVDIQMPGGSGLQVLPEIRRLAPGTAVAMLTTFGKDDYVARALSGGANGFLLKAGDPRELIAGVHAVAAGGAYLSPKVARRLAGHLMSSPPSPSRPGGGDARVDMLSRREREVLALLGEGLSNAGIARRLHLVEDTVKTHVSSILARLGVANRVQAAILAYEWGLVDTSALRRR